MLLSPPTAGACGTHTTGVGLGVIVTLVPPRVIAWPYIVTLFPISASMSDKHTIFCFVKGKGVPALLKIMYPLARSAVSFFYAVILVYLQLNGTFSSGRDSFTKLTKPPGPPRPKKVPTGKDTDLACVL